MPRRQAHDVGYAVKSAPDGAKAQAVPGPSIFVAEGDLHPWPSGYEFGLVRAAQCHDVRHVGLERVLAPARLRHIRLSSVSL
jgi:hypothetical protein